MLLLQMSHVAWSVCLLACLSVFESVCWAHGWAVQNLLNRSRCSLGTDSRGPKEPCVRWRSRSSYRKGHFWGGTCTVPLWRTYASMHSAFFANLRWQNACSAHAADECIRHRDGLIRRRCDRLPNYFPTTYARQSSKVCQLQITSLT